MKAGAGEIDIVITRAHVLQGNWVELYEEVSMLLASWVRTSTNSTFWPFLQTKAMRAACGDAHLKAIIATGELATMTNVYKASLVCMMAGADFIKVGFPGQTPSATCVSAHHLDCCRLPLGRKESMRRSRSH